MSRRELTDDDWAPLRDAVPAFAKRWAEITSDADYDPTIPSATLDEFAQFVAATALREHPDEVEALGAAIEALYTRAALTDDESLEGLLTVGLLESLIDVADEHGIALTRLGPLLRGPLTRDQWEQAIAYQKPGFVWSDEKGAIPSAPRPRPVGTIEVHRGRRDGGTGHIWLDVRLVSGAIREGFLLRFPVGKDSWFERAIASVLTRSPDVPDELEIEVVDEPAEGVDLWQLYLNEWYLHEEDKRFWQIAAPPE
jgi:hypothetical protein